MMWDIGGVFFMDMKQPVHGLARPAGDRWITGESSGVSARGQAHRGRSKADRRPSRKTEGRVPRGGPKGRLRLSRKTGGQAPRRCPKARHRLSRKAEDPVHLGKASRSVARTGPSLEVGAWIAAAMLGGRAREASRAAAACLRGAAALLGRVAGDPAAAVMAVAAMTLYDPDETWQQVK